MRVAVLYNQPVLPADDPEAEAERWVATAVENVAGMLAAAGHTVVQIGIGRSLAALTGQLVASEPDAVFNLYEGVADRPCSEAAVARFLERLRLPFTGSRSRALRGCLHKHSAKRRLVAAGLPTPRWTVANRLPISSLPLQWPVIIKPACRDASEGIDQNSVVTSSAAMDKRVAAIVARYGWPVLIERFLTGREFTISLIETPTLVALPIAEVLHAPTPASPWPILSYEAKWMPGSPDYEATDMLHAAPLEAGLASALTGLAKRAYRALGCRDYARIDFRLDADGSPMVLEVNPNPDMSPTACFAYALAAAGMDRAKFVVKLTEQAGKRHMRDDGIASATPLGLPLV